MNKLRKPTSDFTIIPNGLLRDPRISFKAKGLYCLLFSKPDDWTYLEAALLKECAESKDSFRSGLLELAASGWITKRQVRGDDGIFSRTEIWLNEKPVDGETVAGQAVAGKPVDGSSADGKSAPTNTDVTKTDETNIPRKAPIAKVSDRFDELWKVYPLKVGKPKALASWRSQKLDERVPEILAGLERWKASQQWRRDGGKFIPHPTTFLNQRRWEDQPEPERPAAQKFGDGIAAF